MPPADDGGDPIGDRGRDFLGSISAVELAYLEGLATGFFVDGAGGTLGGLKDLFWDGPNWLRGKAADSFGTSLEVFSLGIRAGTHAMSFVNRLRGTSLTEAVLGAAELHGEIHGLPRQLLDLSWPDRIALASGRTEGLDGKLPDWALTAVDILHPTLQRLVTDVKEAAANLTPEQAAGLYARVAGMVLYELAEGGALAAVTAEFGGAGAAAKLAKVPIIGARLQGIINSFVKPGRYGKTIRAADYIEEIAESAIAVATSEICFVAGTKVHTPDGLRDIETIRPGDLVLTRPEDGGPGGDTAYKPVTETFVTRPTELLHLTVRTDGGVEETLSTTGPHPFYAIGRAAFVAAEDLAEGDLLSLPGGRTAVVAAVRRERAAGAAFTTYNFSVADCRTYFVGGCGAWVHNVGAGFCQLLAARHRRLTGKGGLFEGNETGAFRHLQRAVERRVKNGGMSYPDAQRDMLDAMGILKRDGKLPDDAALDSYFASGRAAGGPLAGSPEHKALRWSEYQSSGGDWSYERWSRNYEGNMVRAQNSNAAVDAYRKRLGWGTTQHTVHFDGFIRRLDIADPAALRGIEHKIGCVSRTADVRSELARDAVLVRKGGWQIEWVFDGTASGPLLEALKKARISYRFL